MSVFVLPLILLCESGRLSAAQADEPNVEYRFNFESDDGTYAFKVVRLPPPEATMQRANSRGFWVTARQVVIECLDRCKCEGAYHENIGVGSGWPAGSGLTGIFQVDPASRHLVTTWMTGQTYNVVVYGCEAGRFSQVLSVGSRGRPLIYSDPSGMPVIEYSPDDDQPKVRATLRWNGKRYVAASPATPRQ